MSPDAPSARAGPRSEPAHSRRSQATDLSACGTSSHRGARGLRTPRSSPARTCRRRASASSKPSALSSSPRSQTATMDLLKKAQAQMGGQGNAGTTAGQPVAGQPQQAGSGGGDFLDKVRATLSSPGLKRAGRRLPGQEVGPPAGASSSRGSALTLFVPRDLGEDFGRHPSGRRASTVESPCR